MRDLRIAIKKDARRALKSVWGKAIAILIILFGVNMLFAILDKGAQSLFPMTVTASLDYLKEFFYQLSNISIVFLIIIAMIAVMRWIIVVPLTIGRCEWYLGLTDGRAQPVAEIFSPFGSKIFARSIGFKILMMLITTFYAVLFTCLPASALGYGIYTMYTVEQTPQNSIMTIMCLILGTVLLAISLLLLFVFLQRYYLGSYLLASRYNMTPFKAIRTSVKYTKGGLWEIFMLKISFLPWLLTSIFLFPLFFVLPYKDATLAIYARYLIESGKRGEAPFTQEFDPPV